MDLRIAHRIEELGKPCAIVVNKWDLAEDFTQEDYGVYLDDRLPMLSYAPVSFISALNGLHVKETIELAGELFRQSNIRVPTGELNAILAESQLRRRPPRRKNTQPKIFYGTQLSGAPPTFLLFASHPQLITAQYTRYLCGFIRDKIGPVEVPVRVFYRSRHTNAPGRESDRRAEA